MNKPIIGAIAAVLALCASTAPVTAKTRTVAPASPKPTHIVETAEGFIIQERHFAALASDLVPASIRVGASVRIDAAMNGIFSGSPCPSSIRLLVGTHLLLIVQSSLVLWSAPDLGGNQALI
ncbi:MAG: hypothetical protein QM605_02960 [Sphingobium sp.]